MIIGDVLRAGWGLADLESPYIIGERAWFINKTKKVRTCVECGYNHSDQTLPWSSFILLSMDESDANKHPELCNLFMYQSFEFEWSRTQSELSDWKRP